MDLELAEKVALVTRASRGIGKAIVKALVEKTRERFGRIDILISNASALAVQGDPGGLGRQPERGRDGVGAKSNTLNGR
ncbi:MAG: hypothetical protein KGY48_02470 [Wenzhouxiangellaceae bacterium]|nr:hypothetical protein [Wenzhouxiangellaceae bacterium]MBS3746753.1 hypothetical protein [Wenzhouxiangellaceae bacterium]MBS3824088.1 hypothetical protein [Wenzhouxiangellaceae bacterium]